jgi:endoglucanase
MMFPRTKSRLPIALLLGCLSLPLIAACIIAAPPADEKPHNVYLPTQVGNRPCKGEQCLVIPRAAECSGDECPFIHRYGREIRDENGDPLVLRGVNLGGWLNWEGWIFGGGFDSETTILNALESAVGEAETNAFQKAVYEQYITEADFREIAALGFNVVRIPFNHRLLEEDESPYVYKQSGWEMLDRVIDLAERHNLYVVLTLHSAPGGQAQLFTADPDAMSLWESVENQKRTAALWKAIAARYRDRRIIAGYDLLNEPDPDDNQKLLALYTDTIKAIREVDPYHMIILEGANLGTDFSLFNGPLSENQAYSFHMYSWLADNRAEILTAYRLLSIAHDVPFWNGEFGENGHDVIESTIALFEEPPYGLSGWAFWTWKKVPNRYPYLIGHEVPASWKDFISGVGWSILPEKVLTADQTRQSMEDFLNSLQQENYSEDQRMIDILTQSLR